MNTNNSLVYFQNYIMAARQPLDDLLELLVTPTESDNNVDIIDDTDDIPNLENSQHSNEPITPKKLTKLTIKNLSSTSVKKIQKKQTNCKFCSKFKFSREQVEKHLNESETCFLLYLRQERVNCMDGILLKLYRCMCCGAQGKFQLKKHVEQNAKCLNFFETRFKCKTWKEVNAVIIKLLRPSHPSRSSCKRKLENTLMATKRKNAVTVTQGLNKFRKDISLANYRLCVCCHQFFLNSGNF